MKKINALLITLSLFALGALSSCSVIENIIVKEPTITYEQNEDGTGYTIDCKGRYNKNTLTITSYEHGDLTIVDKKAFTDTNLETLNIIVDEGKKIQFEKKVFADSTIDELNISGKGNVYFSSDCFDDATISKITIDSTEIDSRGSSDTSEIMWIDQLTIKNSANAEFVRTAFTQVDLYDATLKCTKCDYLFVHNDNSSYTSAFTNKVAYFDEGLKVGHVGEEEIKYTTAAESGFFTTKYHHIPLAYTIYLPESIEAVPAGLFGDEYIDENDSNNDYAVVFASDSVPQIVNNYNSRFTFNSDTDINLTFNEGYTVEEILSKYIRNVEDENYNNQDNSTISDTLTYKLDDDGYILKSKGYSGDTLVIGKHEDKPVIEVDSGAFKECYFKKVEIYTYKSKTLEIDKNAFKNATIEELTIKGAGNVTFESKALKYCKINNLSIERANVHIKKLDGVTVLIDSLSIKDNAVANLENCSINIVNLYDADLKCTVADLVLVHDDNSKYSSRNTNGIIAFEEGLKVSENGIDEKYTAIEVSGLFDNKYTYVPVANTIYLPSTTGYVPQRMLGTENGSGATLYLASDSVNISPIMNNNYDVMELKTNTPVLLDYLNSNNINKELVSETKPTCVDKGAKTYYIETLNFTVKDFTNALGHSYDEGVVIEQPTCQKEGVKEYTCSVCQHTYQETIDKVNHDYSIFLYHTNPTCQHEGYDLYQCTMCDETLPKNVVSKIGHDYSEHVEHVEATCQHEGYDLYKCSMCDDTIKTNVINKLDHDYSVLVEHVEPTCAHEGYDLYKCSMCDETQKMNIVNKLPHTIVTDKAVEPDCCHTGLTEGSHCSECGEIIVKQEIVDKIDHNYTIEVEHVDSTCKDKGHTTYKCTMCDDTKTIELDLLPHTIVIDDAKPADCCHTGLTEGSHCSECGEILVEQEIIPITDHNDGECIDGKCDGCGTEVADIGEIASLTDFNNIDSHKDYYLSCDIDFSTYTQSKASFFGKLYGNGYSITNLKVPLFIENVGLIENIVFKDCTISASAYLKATDSDPVYSSDGNITEVGLVCRTNASKGTINKCVLDDCTFNYEYTVESYYSHTYFYFSYLVSMGTVGYATFTYDGIKMGGFACNNNGNITNCKIKNISVNSNVDVTYEISGLIFNSDDESRFTSNFGFGAFCHTNTGSITGATCSADAKINCFSKLISNKPKKHMLTATSNMNVGKVCISGEYSANKTANIETRYETGESTYKDSGVTGNRLTNVINAID